MTDRPILHFAPASNWMNDPNGLVFHEGLYHLYFQHNPVGIEHANMSWGHATSSDLISWHEHPVAILCDEREQIFSGSIVVDVENRSGLGAPGESPFVAIYTSASRVSKIQAQYLAFSVDGGMTWTKYLGNPVLDRGSENFRDPKVFRYGDVWVMVAVEAEQHQVLFYRSDDLLSWEYLSSFGPAGATGGVWECPDLFPLELDGDPDEIRWVLLVSLNPGGVAGGSGTQYFVGHFDGTNFSCEDVAVPDGPDASGHPLWLDFGHDCYAGVTFNGLADDRRVLIAWMSNWEYARSLPSTPWRGSMTVARELSLRSVDGRAQLRAWPILPAGERADVPINDLDRGISLPGACRIELRVRMMPGEELRLDVVDDQQHTVVTMSYSSGSRALTLQRTAASPKGTTTPPLFAGASEAILPGDDAIFDATMIVDRGSLEIFAADGMRVLTEQLISPPNQLRVSPARSQSHIERCEVRELRVAE